MTRSEMPASRLTSSPGDLRPNPQEAPPAVELSVTVNGHACRVAAGSTIADLLRRLHIDPRLIVVEHNREIVHDRGTFADRPLRAGDALELVQLVGGG